MLKITEILGIFAKNKNSFCDEFNKFEVGLHETLQILIMNINTFIVLKQIVLNMDFMFTYLVY